MGLKPEISAQYQNHWLAVSKATTPSPMGIQSDSGVFGLQIAICTVAPTFGSAGEIAA